MGWPKFRWTDSGWNLDFHPDIIQDEENTEVVFRERPLQTGQVSTRESSLGIFGGRTKSNNSKSLPTAGLEQSISAFAASAKPPSKTDTQGVKPPLSQGKKARGKDKNDREWIQTFRTMVFMLFLLVALAIALAFLFGGQEQKPPGPTTSNGVEEEEINTFVPISNDQCDSADLITPDGSSEVGVLLSTTAFDTFSNGVGQCGTATYGTSAGKWYQVELPPGVTSDVATLKACTEGCAVSSGSLVIPEVSIFTGTCTDLHCVDGVADLAGSSDLSFPIENDQTYYIFLQGGQGSLGLFDVSLSL